MTKPFLLKFEKMNVISVILSFLSLQALILFNCLNDMLKMIDDENDVISLITSYIKGEPSC